MRGTEQEFIEQIEREYKVCNMDRDKFWDAFIRDLPEGVTTAEIGSRLWSAIMQGYLKAR